jgi:hypothetical protein
MEVSDQRHVSIFTLEDRRLGGLHGRYGRDGKKKKKKVAPCRKSNPRHYRLTALFGGPSWTKRAFITELQPLKQRIICINMNS